MRLLFITATRIGDAVLSTGILDHLIRTHPGARVTVACGPAAAGLFAHVPGLDRVAAMQKRPLALHWLSLWRASVGTRWDLAVDLRGSAITGLLRAQRRIVRRGGRKGIHRVAELGGLLGLDPPPLPVVWTSAAEQAAAARRIPPGPPVIGLGPTANWPGKVWPAEKFVALFDALTTTPLAGARAAIFAGPGEAERAGAEAVMRALPRRRVIDLAGQLSLTEAAAHLARCDLYVGNDSGLMHLAAAAGAPTLGLFGPSPPEEYAPAGPRAAFVRTPETMAELIARPGYDHRTTGTLMGTLGVDAAVAAARALLDRAGRRAAE
jgi:ADP-heptose:LPS heptosyltransferase